MKARITVWYPGFTKDVNELEIWDKPCDWEIEDGVLSFYTDQSKTKSVAISGMPFRIEME